MVCPSQRSEANIQIFPGSWNCWSHNSCHSGMVANEGPLARHKVTELGRTGGDPMTGKGNEWQFEGGSECFSRFEHQKLDWFISMKTNSEIFRLIRPFARDCYHSEMWHLMWLWCRWFRFTQGTKKGKIIYHYVGWFLFTCKYLCALIVFSFKA